MDKKLFYWEQLLKEGMPPLPPVTPDVPASVPPAGPDLKPNSPYGPGQKNQGLDIPMDDTAPDEVEGEEDSPLDTTGDLELLDFEDFREEYIDATVNGKPDDLLDKLEELRGIVDLGPKEKKFMTDNIQILLLQQEQGIYETYRKLHKIEEPLDLLAQLSESIDKSENLSDVIRKLPSFFGMKSDLYRKFLAALIGAVQIGGGSVIEDLVLSPTKGQRILFSTRFYTTFGFIELIPWKLHQEDSDLYLKDVERERLDRGSPEEKKVLLKRIILASITKFLQGRIFQICIANRSSGHRHDIGIQLDRFLLDGYESGALKMAIIEDKESLTVTPKGETAVPGKVVFAFTSKEEPNAEPVPFLEAKDGKLALVADANNIENAINEIGAGVFLKSEYEGTSDDLESVQRCVPTLQEMLLKRC